MMSEGKQQSTSPADIDSLALQAEADQDIAIERKASGKPEKPAHALASMLGPAFVAAVAYVDPRRTSPPALNTAICWCGCSWWPTA